MDETGPPTSRRVPVLSSPSAGSGTAGLEYPAADAWTPRQVLVGATLFTALALAGLFYAKWWPYSHKLLTILRRHAYPGRPFLTAAGGPTRAPSWHSTWSFVVSYGNSVYVALAAAILIAAGIETLLPATSLAPLRRPGRVRTSFWGGLLALPCLMCTCCSAPLTRSMRRSGVPVSAAASYWLGNPLLNPAVLVFLVLVLPWQYTAVRALFGLVIVFGVAPLVSRLAPAGGGPGPGPDRLPSTVTPRPAPVRYLRAVGRFLVILVPEYFVAVLAVGALRGWLFPFGHSAIGRGALAALVAAAAGALLVIPTAAEIPIISALVALGFSGTVTGALLISLPALSLPSMVMVGRALSVRVTVAIAVAVVACALAAGGLMAALGG